MNYIKNLEKKQIKRNLINKFNYQKINDLPKIKSITLSFGGRSNEIKTIAQNLLALELLTEKTGKFTRTSKPNVSLKIRKGHPVGCSLKLTNKNLYIFLSKLINEILPYSSSKSKLKTIKSNNQYSFKLENTLNFSVLKENYIIFRNVSDLRITISSTTNTKKELLFLLKSFNIV